MRRSARDFTGERHSEEETRKRGRGFQFSDLVPSNGEGNAELSRQGDGQPTYLVQLPGQVAIKEIKGEAGNEEPGRRLCVPSAGDHAGHKEGYPNVAHQVGYVEQHTDRTWRGEYIPRGPLTERDNDGSGDRVLIR